MGQLDLFYSALVTFVKSDQFAVVLLLKNLQSVVNIKEI